MHCIKELTKKVFWVGASDRRIELFENAYPLKDGVSYNSYMVLDDKTVLFDTVDKSVSNQYLDNVSYLLGDRDLDYIVVQHMEPDHSATLFEVLEKYKEAKVIINKKTMIMLEMYTDMDLSERVLYVEDIGELCTGECTFSFVLTPMVHWPEVMMTFEKKNGILFSADAFGTFGALNGNIFADKVYKKGECWEDLRRYYTNIVGKYGASVKAVMNKAGALPIKFICPLHGPVWRRGLRELCEKYTKWANYESEDNEVVVFYSSVYGNTESAVNGVCLELDRLGVDNIKAYDLSKTHYSYCVAEAFRASHIIFASVTYNAGLFTSMETLLAELKAHNVQGKKYALIENGSWAPLAGKFMKDKIDEMKNMYEICEKLTIKGACKEDKNQEINQFASAIYGSLKG